MAEEEELVDLLAGEEGEEVEWMNNPLYESPAMSEEALDREAVSNFKEENLSTRKKFARWAVKGGKAGWKGIKAGRQGLKALGEVIAPVLGIAMLYEMINKHADHAEKTGKRVTLSAAIDGAKQTLVDKHDETVIKPAKDFMAGDSWPKFKKDDPEGAAKVEAIVLEPGVIYWSLVGDDIMEKMAEMPIYTPV